MTILLECEEKLNERQSEVEDGEFNSPSPPHHYIKGKMSEAVGWGPRRGWHKSEDKDGEFSESVGGGGGERD